MKEFVHSKTPLIQELKKDESSLNEKFSKGTNAKLKLVVSNPDPMGIALSGEKSNTKNASTLSSFTVEVLVKGPCLYEMTIHDPIHYLKCNLFLEVDDSNQEYEGKTVICHFPTLSGEELNDFIEEDETLYGMIMIQFQMKILEQLFLFCTTHYASTLVIYTDDVQADALGVYQDFLTYKDQTLTSKGEKTEMVIPADHETFDAWIDFMQKMTAEFQQSLWHDQKTNPVIRRHLKMQCARVSLPSTPCEGQETHNAKR